MVRAHDRGADPEETHALFDVVCAGEVPWSVAPGFRIRAGRGAVSIAVALRLEGLGVGLATTLVDDERSRSLVSAVRGRGVDVGGVALRGSSTTLYVVDGTGDAQSLVAHRAETPPVEVPLGWSSRMVVLSGLAPGVTYAASLCRAARAARRKGTFVVVDVNAHPYAWVGRDPRTILSILREADAVRVTTRDLVTLGWTETAVQKAMRPNAVLVATHGPELVARAIGPFGEIVRTASPAAGGLQPGADDAFTGALCAVLARGIDRAELPDVWVRALTRGLAAATRVPP